MRRCIATKPARNNPEEQIQFAIVLHLAVRCTPGTVWWHTPNGGARRKSEASRFKALGVKAGVPDILALRAGRLHALELKSPGGRLSLAQADMLGLLAAAGAHTAVAVGLDDALAELERWGLLRPSGAAALPKAQTERPGDVTP